MTPCVREEALVALATGDADPAAAAHVRSCAACGARLAALRDDLSLLRTALREAPLPLPVHRPTGVWAAGAAIAVTAALTILLAHTLRAPESPAGLAAAPADHTAAFADEVASAVFPGVSTRSSDDSAVLIAALGGGGHCDGGLGAGCDVSDLLAAYE